MEGELNDLERAFLEQAAGIKEGVTDDTGQPEHLDKAVTLVHQTPTPANEDPDTNSGSDSGTGTPTGTKDDSADKPKEDKPSEEKPEEQEITVGDYLAEQFGLTERGFDNTYEGVEKVVNLLRAKERELANEELISKYPNIKTVLEYIERGGSVDTLFVEPSVKGLLEGNKEDVGYQKSIVSHFYKNGGLDDKTIKEKLDALSEEQIAQEFNLIFPVVEKSIKEQAKAKIEEEKRIYEETVRAQQEWTEEQKNIVSDDTKLKGIGIDPARKEVLLDYMFVKDKDGTTKFDKALGAMTKEQVIWLADMMQQGFSPKEYAEKVKRTVNTSKRELELEKIRKPDSGSTQNNDFKTSTADELEKQFFDSISQFQPQVVR